MKHFLLILFISLIGCSKKIQPSENPKPAWLNAKPFPSGYYTGIGHSTKDVSTNYIQIAKKSALEDLVSEIKVTVSSTSVLSQIDLDKQFHERYEQIIQTEAADEIEEFELVDSWQDENNYWVYYRLSKNRYREIKEEQKRNAVLLATDYYKKGLAANDRGDRIQAMSFYFQAFRSVEKYLAEPIRVMIHDREVFITNEIYSSIQSLLDQVNLMVDPKQIELNRRMNQNEQTIIVKAEYKDLNAPARDFPLLAEFEKGEGIVFPHYKTNDLGESKILLTKIGSRELEQTVSVKGNIEILSGGGSSPIFSLVAQSLHVPYAQVILKVLRPVVYLTTEEKTFGFRNSYGQVSNRLKNFLATSGFEFTDDMNAADLWIDVKTDTERGSVSGSIYITYLTGVIRVSSARAGKEIYATTLDRIKGYGLDYDRSSIDAYSKTVETLEKNNMNELLDTVLH